MVRQLESLASGAAVHEHRSPLGEPRQRVAVGALHRVAARVEALERRHEPGVAARRRSPVDGRDGNAEAPQLLREQLEPDVDDAG